MAWAWFAGCFWGLGMGCFAVHEDAYAAVCVCLALSNGVVALSARRAQRPPTP